MMHAIEFLSEFGKNDLISMFKLSQSRSPSPPSSPTRSNICVPCCLRYLSVPLLIYVSQSGKSVLNFKGTVLCWNSELEQFSKWPRKHRERGGQRQGLAVTFLV